MPPRRKKTPTELRFEAFKASKARGAKPSRAGAAPKAVAPATKAKRAPVKLPPALTPRPLKSILGGLSGKFDKQATPIPDPAKKKRKRR
jgi:hypothetical protein